MPNFHVSFSFNLAAEWRTKKLLKTGTCDENGLMTGALSDTDEAKPNTSYKRAKDTLRKEIFKLKFPVELVGVFIRMLRVNASVSPKAFLKNYIQNRHYKNSVEWVGRLFCFHKIWLRFRRAFGRLSPI